MAANPLAVNLASEALGQPISWGAWALAGIVPGLICLAAAPLILYVLYPPGKSLSIPRMAASKCFCAHHTSVCKGACSGKLNHDAVLLHICVLIHTWCQPA